MKVRDVCGTEIKSRTQRRHFLNVNLVLLVHEREEVGEATDAFRCAQHQVAFRIECIMKNRNAFFLQLWAEIDKDIAAGNQIDVRKGRVFGNILTGEGAHVSNGAADLVATIRGSREKAA